MAETNTNNQANVSAGKGVKGGYIFSAPVGTALPTDIKSKLDPAFKCLGFISEDGYVEDIDEDSDDIVDIFQSALPLRGATATFCSITLLSAKYCIFKDHRRKISRQIPQNSSETRRCVVRASFIEHDRL